MIYFAPSIPSSSFATGVQIYFSPKPYTVVKNQRWSDSFYRENTERSLAKITPVLQTTNPWQIVDNCEGLAT